MRIDRNQLLTVLSEALDHVEKEVLGVTDHHAKRVAWLCIRMGKAAGMSEEEISDLAVGALLHDNALNEYKEDYENGKLKCGASGDKHCIAGEKNLKLFTKEAKQLRSFVLYHHECADGSGPFGKLASEVPLGAQLVHIADEMDLMFAFGNAGEETLAAAEAYALSQKGKAFSAQAVELFQKALTPEIPAMLSNNSIEKLILEFAPVEVEADRGIAELFARIIDYKSPFTKAHSVGVAEKAERMAECFGYDKERTERIYMAAALHDIGKLLVDIEVLEKPGRLDEEEYKHIQSHAYETYRLLSKIEGFEEICGWAAYHHEKLNGKGYPFGLAEAEMCEEVRLLACLDIYQALTEDRPYKAGMTHEKAIGILYELADKGDLDRSIVEKMDVEFGNGATEVSEETTALFQCQVCGCIYEGDVVPNEYVCPVCMQPAHAFYRVR